MCVLVIGWYAYIARLGGTEWSKLNPANSYYNLLVQGFRAGQLSLKREAPPGFANLVDPYDPVANRAYRDLPYSLSDLSYYNGKFYLYFGVTPALLLFWPFVAATGHYLFDRQAVTICCAIGFLANVSLLYALWRRYFAGVNWALVTACVLALGLVAGVPMLLPRSDIYQVAISCGYMLTMLALICIWRALHDTERGWRWMAAASLAYGLAVGARPNLLFGAVVLLVPIAQAWRSRRRVGALLMAAVGPMVLIGLGLMLYNFLRFGNPFEFGIRYELASQRQLSRQFFSLRYLCFNFRLYFLEPVSWRAPFPFVHSSPVPPMPAGYYDVSDPFGILANIPLVWLALAAPLAWRGRGGQAGRILRWFVTTLALSFGIGAFTVGLFCCTASRFEVEFLPALLLLAVVGFFGLQRAVADRVLHRRVVLCSWGLLLTFSIVCSLLITAENYAFASCTLGTMLANSGHVLEGIHFLQKGLEIKPDNAEGHSRLADALLTAGKPEDAIREFEQALRIKPDYAEAHNSLGVALVHADQITRAIGHYKEALRIKPDYVAAHYNLGAALQRAGHVQEAIEYYEQAVRLQPDFPEAHNNLAVALANAGQLVNAIGHYEQAVRLKPDFAEAHFNWGVALQRAGQTQEAIEQYEQALQIKPDFFQAQTQLARLRAVK